MARMSREERLAQAEECLASGMTVRDWCAANGVPEATMYVWVRRLREEPLPYSPTSHCWPIREARMRVIGASMTSC